MKRKISVRDAYLTVEAALLAPVLLATVMLLIYLTLHVHNRTSLYTLAAQQAISGEKEEDPELIFARELTSQFQDGDWNREVSYDAGTIYFTGELRWHTEEKAAYRKYQPVRDIRIKQAGKRALNTIFE